MTSTPFLPSSIFSSLQKVHKGPDTEFLLYHFFLSFFLLFVESCIERHVLTFLWLRLTQTIQQSQQTLLDKTCSTNLHQTIGEQIFPGFSSLVSVFPYPLSSHLLVSSFRSLPCVIFFPYRFGILFYQSDLLSFEYFNFFSCFSLFLRPTSILPVLSSFFFSLTLLFTIFHHIFLLFMSPSQI